MKSSFKLFYAVQDVTTS